mmetsp:Transcript_15251/g.40937  ORF Transcript_15251/g.40937 Transcript_15251/m.40937 type:complete len:240 (+) Transcript_15251:2165-2884(+)
MARGVDVLHAHVAFGAAWNVLFHPSQKHPRLFNPSRQHHAAHRKRRRAAARTRAAASADASALRTRACAEIVFRAGAEEVAHQTALKVLFEAGFARMRGRLVRGEQLLHLRFEVNQRGGAELVERADEAEPRAVGVVDRERFERSEHGDAGGAQPQPRRFEKVERGSPRRSENVAREQVWEERVGLVREVELEKGEHVEAPARELGELVARETQRDGFEARRNAGVEIGELAAHRVVRK